MAYRTVDIKSNKTKGDKMIPDFIGLYENALSKDDCESIIARIDEFKNNGYGITRGEAQTRKADEAFFDTSDPYLTEDQRNNFFNCLWNFGYKQYAGEFDVLSSFGKHSVEQVKAQITKPGQGYHVWHAETDIPAHSKRILAYILYLNDIDEGAETEFLYYRKRIAPKQGSLLIFPAHFTHTHRGNTNLSDQDKYILTGWFSFSYE